MKKRLALVLISLLAIVAVTMATHDYRVVKQEPAQFTIEPAIILDEAPPVVLVEGIDPLKHALAKRGTHCKFWSDIKFLFGMFFRSPSAPTDKEKKDPQIPDAISA